MPLLEGKLDPLKFNPANIGAAIQRAMLRGLQSEELRWVDVGEDVIQHLKDGGIVK
jgi:hypothetical protein